MALSLPGSSGFDQQGSVDWVSLANTTVSATVSVFNRLAAADVHPGTLATAHAIAGTFWLSAQGETNVDNALKSLTSFSSIGQVLHFGFGIEAPVRHLAKTQNGYACLALFGALNELAPTKDSAAYLLRELADLMGAPRESRPSLRQWNSLLDVCAGMFSATTFPVIFNQYQRLSEECSSYVGSPRDIAEALLAVAKLARQELDAISITGTTACSWLAAFGHYFLGLSVCIQDPQGLVRYKSGTGNQASITIECPWESLWTGQLVERKRYVIRTFEDLYRVANPAFSGRVRWEEALSVAFGRHMDELLFEGRFLFAQILGCTARLMEAVASADQALQSVLGLHDALLLSMRERWVGYCEDSHGAGFLRFATGTFPELSGCKSEASLWLSSNLRDAYSGYLDAVLGLQDLCGCQNHDTHYRREWCLQDLADGVIFIVYSLSLTSFNPDLRPSLLGLRRYAELQRANSEQACLPERRLARLFEQMTLRQLMHRVAVLFSGVSYHVDSNSMKSAVCLGGVCTFLDSLVHWPDRPGHSKWLRVVCGVIQSRGGCQFQWVLDGKTREEDYPSCEVKVATDLSGCVKAHPVRSDTVIDLVVEETLTDLYATIRFHGSESCRQSSESDRRQSRSYSIGPVGLAIILARSTGTVPCTHSKACHEEIDLTSVFYSEGSGPIRRADIGLTPFSAFGRAVNESVPNDHSIVVLRPEVPGGIAATLALCSSNDISVLGLPGNAHPWPQIWPLAGDELVGIDARHAHAGCIFRQEECMRCCIREAKRRVPYGIRKFECVIG